MTADLTLISFSMVYFFFLLGMQTFENTLVARFSPESFRHTAFGAKFVLTFGVGALGVTLVERIEAVAGIEKVFWSLAVLTILIVGVIFLLIQKTNRHQAMEGLV